MIILDTNVLSEFMSRAPNPAVVRWLDKQPRESVWLTSVTVFEIVHGLEILAKGRRRQQLQDAFVAAMEEDLDGRVLELDRAAAQEAGLIAARQRLAGKTVEIRDALIAGIARSRRATLATRNTRQFQPLDIALVDPWN